MKRADFLRFFASICVRSCASGSPTACSSGICVIFIAALFLPAGFFLHGAFGAPSVDYELLALDLDARGDLYARHLLVREAEHASAFEAEEVRMVAGASVRAFAVRAEAPHAVDALHLVDDARLAQRLERAVERDSVEVLFDF